eukprot:TRINITY_DN82238_c0_g1_i1.p2 TRINITY_DN82238_c0_g1~~TRINITY_DN82238_c0_g1_i1.p2  ORF type:complete len:138 (-),score=37.91 TRINITY_DN82238_c0_g1_i1:127-540(-)
MADREALTERTNMAIETAEKFCELFYNKIDKERHTIEKLYLPTATFTWNGNFLEGSDNIQRFITHQLPRTEHFLNSLDSQPLPNQAVGEQTTVLVTACGNVRYDKKAAIPFQQNFLVTEKDMKWKIAVDNFRSQGSN